MLLLFSKGELQSPSSCLHCTDKGSCSLGTLLHVLPLTEARTESRHTANPATGLLSKLKSLALLYRLLECQVLYLISDPVKKVGTGLVQVPLTLATGLILFHFLEGTYF